MKAIRYIIFIPIIYLIIDIVYSILPLSLFALMALSKFWVIILLLFFGGFCIGLFQFLPGGITWLSAKISPSKNFAFYSILTISILLAVRKIIDIWTMSNEDDNSLSIFFSIIFTCLTIGIATSLSVGAGIAIFKEKEDNLNLLLSIGAIIFNIGILLIFCLLTIKICHISLDKTYTWYSGIWHGIFVIPHWIVSWFSDDIYCKAPNSTTTYTVWWWISFIFVGLLVLGGSGSGRRRESY